MQIIKIEYHIVLAFYSVVATRKVQWGTVRGTKIKNRQNLLTFLRISGAVTALRHTPSWKRRIYKEERSLFFCWGGGRPEGWYGITKTYLEATGCDRDYRLQLAQDRIQFQVSLSLETKIVILKKARYSLTSQACPQIMRSLKNSIGDEIFYLRI
jgi:hypothetical protein